jgi:CDP-4-dehydro-6-deoxyglucose reductase, E3
MLVNCLVTLCTPLNDNVYRVILHPGEDKALPFKAGQYLNIEQADGSESPFSIASNPDSCGMLELHIDRHQSTETIFQQIFEERSLKVELPLGDCHLPSPLHFDAETPIILAAATTGFSQMQSIMLKLFNSHIDNPIHLYWGAKQAEGFYMLEQLNKWQEEHENFHFKPVLSNPSKACQWQGRTGLVHQAITEDFESLQDAEVYISGSSTMVYATLDALVNHGLPEQQAHSDAFSIAPRESTPS